MPNLALLTGVVPSGSREESLYTGVYVIYLGLLFLASYYWSDKTFVLRSFSWFCRHSHPPGERMAFFYFALCTILGCMAILSAFGLSQARY